jgi:RNA polymerase sigma-70 factor, ECF subfamily
VKETEGQVTGMTTIALTGRDYPVGPDGPLSATTDSDEEFMRGLYQHDKPQLEAYVRRLTRDVQWAEDIVQAALIRAWHARHLLIGRGTSTRSWLFTVAYRIFVDEYRSRSLRPVKLTGQDIAQPGPDDDYAERLALSITLARAMAGLSEAHRQAIVHVYYLNRTADEAASMLGISPGTVKSRVHYALRALRKELAPGAAATTRRTPPPLTLSPSASLPTPPPAQPTSICPEKIWQSGQSRNAKRVCQLSGVA